jgi:hypothetical protein
MIDTLQSMRDEIDECVELLRPVFTGEDTKGLRARAECMRSERYARGRWPTRDELVEQREKEVREAAIRAEAEAADREKEAALAGSL